MNVPPHTLIPSHLQIETMNGVLAAQCTMCTIGSWKRKAEVCNNHIFTGYHTEMPDGAITNLQYSNSIMLRSRSLTEDSQDHHSGVHGGNNDHHE